MIDKTYSQLKRSIATILVLAIVLQCGFFGPIPVRAVTETIADGRLALGDGLIKYQQILRDEGNGKYTLTVKLKDATNFGDDNQDPTISRNDYFTAPADGDYLIQLWGGDGASGNASAYGEGGTGGAGGYIYGVVRLKKGQTLFYQLGGKGQQTNTEDAGGGVNGNGGNAGDYTSYIVGGGGGYSAVYLFDVGEFENKYLDADGNLLVDTITEEDRVSKHIMIAGGGGGGGAGSGMGLSILQDAGNPPDGGIGGTVGVSAYDTLPDGGTYFAGGNGLTSGSDTTYVGMGGTDVPGDAKASILGSIGLNIFDGIQPNDWVRSYDANTPGGNGGAGNLRGGSGGAGFTGGSGGLQTEIIVPTNVGGGGGGSSYVASIVDYTLTDAQKAKLVDVERTGAGGIMLTSLSDAGIDQAAISLTYTVSNYFTMTTEDTVINENAEDEFAGGRKIVLTFTVKTGFAGGNGVPLLQDDVITLTDGTNTATMTLDADCSMVNVPLNFEAIGKNYMSNKAGLSVDKTHLYEDNVSGIDLDAWQYAFIHDISTYEVYNSDWTKVTDASVAPASTTRYYVGYTVTPKTDTVATVGEVVDKTLVSAVAIVSVVEAGIGTLNNNSVRYEKELRYDGSEYILTLKTKVSSAPISASDIATRYYKESSGTYVVLADGYYYIQAWGGNGGGGGGATNAGGSSSLSYGGTGGYLEGYVYLEKGDILSISVGKHGTSQLDVGSSDIPRDTFVSAAAGTAGQSTTVGLTSKSTGAKSELMIAGGGGGGGAAWRYYYYFFGPRGHGGRSGQSAYNAEYTGAGPFEQPDSGNSAWYTQSCVDNVSDVTDPVGGTAYTSYENAGGGLTNPSGNYAPGGAAGGSYMSGSMNTPTKDASGNDIGMNASVDGFTSSNNTNTKGGMVIITCLQVMSEETPYDADMSDYIFTARLSRYFTITGVSGIGLTKSTFAEFEYSVAAESVTVDKATTTSNRLTVKGVTPSTISKDDEGNIVAEFSICIHFVPADGFVGGNNVPVLLYDDEEKLVAEPETWGMQLQQDSVTQLGAVEHLNINVAGQEVTDFANVVIDVNAIGSITIVTADQRTIKQTGANVTGIVPSTLYTWTDKPNIPSGTNDLNYWKYEFVKLFETVTKKGDTTDLREENLPIVPDPLKSTMYTVTVGVKAKTDNPVAVVVNAVSPVSVSYDVEIIVVPRIKYELTNLTTGYESELENGYYHIKNNNFGVSHTAQLIPATGFSLPQSITVTSATGTSINASYNPATGQFTIPVEYLEGTITVTASAVAKTYTITFYKQTAYGSAEFTQFPAANASDDEKAKYQFEAGDPLGDSISRLLPSTPTDAPTGYEFVWDWGDLDVEVDANGVPKTMPGKNLVVIGSYEPIKYTLTIKYYGPDGTEIAELPDGAIASVEVPYGTTYTVNIPTIDGYVCDYEKSTTSVTMGASNQTIEIHYKSCEGVLMIYTSYTNGRVADSVASYDISAGVEYSINIAAAPQHYTVKITDAEGKELTLTDGKLVGTPTQEQIDSGITIYVSYKPDTYQVTFDAKGGTMPQGDYFVEFDNIFNYNAVTGKMDGLPTPVRAGYTFLGWYADLDGDGTPEKIEGAQKVNAVSAVTLVAHWQQNYGTVTIRFLDENNNALLENVVLQYSSGVASSGTYQVSNTQIEIDNVKYTTLTTEISYTFQAQNQVFVVTYYTPKNVTVNYVDVDGNSLKKASVTQDVGTPYSISAPVNGDGYIEVEVNAVTKYYIPTRDPVTGTIGTTDVVVTVVCNEKDVTPTVSITVSWGTLEFVYHQGTWNPETHQYEGSSIDPSKYQENTVTVTSGEESNIAVNVAVAYGEQTTGYEGLTGYFTEEYYKNGDRIEQWSLAPQDSKKVYLWLEGTLDFGSSSGTTGVCTVTITAGTTTQENGT